MKQFLLSALASLGLFFSLSAQDEIYAKDNTAVNGHDVVAYFRESKPVKGSTEFSVMHKGVNWLFANRANAELFKADPEKYEPQYGGYCAYGCSRGYKAKTSPDAWTIVDGKLYLNYNTDVRDTWSKDKQAYILKADSNWTNIKFKKYN